MYTKIKTNNGEEYFLVHGIFGEAYRVIEEGKLTKRMKKKIEEDGGQEIFRMFKTVAECEAYQQGIQDMDGNVAYYYTTTEQHLKIFGFDGAKVLYEEEQVMKAILMTKKRSVKGKVN